MNIWIEYSKTRRRIIGPFNIAGDRNDLESIAQQILGYLKADETISSGIVEIRASHQTSHAGTLIRNWDKEEK